MWMQTPDVHCAVSASASIRGCAESLVALGMTLVGSSVWTSGASHGPGMAYRRAMRKPV